MEDSGITESISKAEPMAAEEASNGSSGTAKQRRTPDESGSEPFSQVKKPDYKWDSKKTSEQGGDLYREAQKGNTRAGAAKPNSKETIKVVNGQYWHRHPGYLSGAKTLDEAEWHPASQRHRGKNGQDITEKLHIAGGLGKNGLLGAPVMSVGQAFMADFKSGGRGASLLGMLADLGFSTAERQVGALFGLADAMLKGNPLSVSSGIVGQAVNAFGGFADDLADAREKYMIPEDVSQSALMMTIMGRAYAGRKEAYEKAYGSEARASDDLLDMAVDKSIVMSSGETFFDEYTRGMAPYVEGDDYGEYLNKVFEAKERWLHSNGNIVDGEDYDLKRRDAVQQMNEDSLQMYSKGLYQRGRDLTRAMDDLIQNGTVYDIDDDGRIDFASARNASSLTGEQIDRYKERLQIGTSMTSQQLQTIAERTKGLQRRTREELANKRRHDAEMKRQEKAIYNARMDRIRQNGTMAEVAVAEVGGNVQVDRQHDPMSVEQLRAASRKLISLMEGNETRARNAKARGITDPADLRKELVFDKPAMDKAKETLDRWQDKINFLNRKSKEAEKEAEGRRLKDMTPSNRIRDVHFNALDSKGLPLSYDGCVRMTSLKRNDRADWEAKEANMKAANANLDGYISDIASAVGKTDAEVLDALSHNPNNNRLFEMLKDMSKAEASIADTKDAYNSYVDLLNTQNVSDAKAVLDACYNALNSMIYQMADGCDASSKAGVVYDRARVDMLNDNLDMFRRAIATGRKISPSEFAVPGGDGFKAVGDQKDVLASLMSEAVGEASKPEFYAPSEDGEFLLKNIFGGAESAAQRRSRQEMLSMMGLRGDLRRVVDESNDVNQFFAALGSRTGSARRGVDPFSYSASTKDDRDHLMNVMRSEMSAYDAYKAKHPDDTALSRAMARHMGYLAEKMAIADMRMAGGMDSTERSVLDSYEADLDKEIRKSLVNSTSAAASWVDMTRLKGGYLGAVPNPDDYADVQNDSVTSLRYMLDDYVGYNRSIKEAAESIGNKFGTMYADPSEYLVSKPAMDDFLGFDGTGPSSKTDIKDATGFDIDSPMDHMLVSALKSAGVESLDSMEGMSEAELDSVFRSIGRRKDLYLNDRGMKDNRQRDVLVRSCIVAQDMVRMYSSRQRAWRMLNESPPAWYTQLGQKFDHGMLEDVFDDSFRSVFKNVKDTRWTFSDLDDLRRKGSRDPSGGQEFTDTDADYMTSVALFCASSGLDPSGGQGVPDPARAKIVRDAHIDELMSAGTHARNIREVFGDMDERFRDSRKTVTVYDKTDPTKRIIHSENNVIMTFSGEMDAYATGNNPNVADSVYPVNLYRMFRSLVANRGRAKQGDVDRILGNFGRAHAGVDMNLDNVRRMYGDNVVDAIALVNSTKSVDAEDGTVLHHQDQVFILPIIQDPATGKREVFLTDEYLDRFHTDNIGDLNSRARGALAGAVRTSGMESVMPDKGKRYRVATQVAPEPLRDERKKASAGEARPWSDESFAKASRCPSPLSYLRSGRRTMERAYGLDLAGGRVIENLLYVAGTKGEDVYVMANRTADAVVFKGGGKVLYVSRRFGDIECGKFRQTLSGADVMVTMPWALVDRTPPCLFYGLLDVYVPWAADGFRDPRVIAETAKTRSSFDEAAEAAALIRDFGGFDDSPDIDADPVARKIRNIIMRAYAKVGAFGRWVFDQARSKAQTMPRITMDSYYTVLSAAYQLAGDITMGPCTSHGAWHLIKGIRSNALLALSANPFMAYRRRYATPRPEVDAIAYIGKDAGSGEREMHVKDMMMLIGLMSACEQIRLWPMIPRFYEDPSPEWKDAADYWYIMLHHPTPPEPFEEQDEGREEEP